MQQLVSVLALLSALFAVFILALVLGTVLYKGLSQLSLDFLTKSSALFGETGGIADALVGSAIIVGMATIMAVPVAILVAIYIAEYAGPKAASFFRVMLDVLNGVPRSSSASSSTGCSSSATARARSTARWRWQS